ncbi:hypothetical protein RND81_10G114500 [Saponaria officinalis]|uniref:Uncharacterized protein n=1 Tax=Saponaria officinalis TaxID=3572 RepID=A0AAW1I141_SAPOF
MEINNNNNTIKPSSTTIEMMRWSSPIPYLFGGLALMLTLIAISLIILVCSYIKNQTNSSDEESGNKSSPIHSKVAFDDLPRVFVVMAGDDKPSYIGKPMPTTTPLESIKCSCYVAHNNNNNLEVV